MTGHRTSTELTGAGLGLGPVSTAWLAAIGIHDRATGTCSAWLVLRQQGYPVTLNLLYALEAALQGCDWRRLPDATREQLRAFARQHPKP